MSGATRPTPDLAGRKARCVCGRLTPSSNGLPDFEYRGPGSRWAVDVCLCGYHRLAHHDDIRSCAVSPTLRNCPGFHPRGEASHDAFWCGCEQGDHAVLQSSRQL